MLENLKLFQWEHIAHLDFQLVSQNIIQLPITECIDKFNGM